MSRRLYASAAQKQAAYRQRKRERVGRTVTPVRAGVEMHAGPTVTRRPLPPATNWAVLELAEQVGWPHIALSAQRWIGQGKQNWLYFTSDASVQQLEQALCCLWGRINGQVIFGS
jgi:hypothetical protein